MNQATRTRNPVLFLLPTLLVIAILLGATALRAYNFEAWPPGLSHDEAINGLDAVRLIRTGVIPFYLRDGRPEPLFRIFQTITVLLIGPTRFGLRLASLFMGVLAVAAAYRAGRHFAPPGSRARRWTGLVSAGVLALMVGHIHLSRVAYRAILQPFAMLMFFDAFVAALEDRKRPNFITAGIWLAVALMSYTAAFVLLPLVVLGALHKFVVWVVDLPDSMERGFDVGGGLRFVLVFLVAISPLLIMLIVQPDMFGRVGEVGSPSVGKILAHPVGYADRLLRTWRSLHVGGDVNPQYNVARSPLLHTPWLYGLLLAGVAACVLRPRRLSSLMAVGYLVLCLLPVALSGEIPHGLRIVGEYAAIPLVVAASVELGLWVADRFERPRWPGAAIRAVWALALAAVLITGGLQSAQIYSTYFQKDVRWGRDGVTSAFSWFFETHRLAMADLIAEQDGVVYVPLSEAARPVTRYFTMRSHPHAATFATYFTAEGPLALPAGRFLLPPDAMDTTTFAAYMPDGTLVLLPRFDDETLAGLRAAVEDGEELYDAYGELAAMVVDFPPDGGEIVLEHPVANPIGAINYDDRIALVGWDATFELPQEGGESVVTLYFTPGTARRRDVLVFTQLWDISGEKIASSDEPLLHRWLYPPDWWQPGDVVPFVMEQHVPGDLTPGAYYIAVGLRDWRARYLPVLGADGTPVANAAIAGVVKVPHGETVSTAGMIPTHAGFGDRIALLGYQITDAASGEPLDSPSPGQSIIVTLYWQALRRPGDDYTVFVHVTGAAGDLIAQNDTQPEGGQYPTGIWGVGEIVTTAHFIMLPTESSGPYTLYAGLYSWPSLERLPVVQDGEVIEDRRAVLGEVQ
jgi:hypothetical protein